MTADVVVEWCAHIRTYDTCMVRIQQEPVPILAGPIFCTVDGHNLYGCNCIRVWWLALQSMDLQRVGEWSPRCCKNNLV